MSRLGRKPIQVPSGVTVELQGDLLSVKGPKGTLERAWENTINFSQEGGVVKIAPKDDSLFAKALWGTFASHIANMIEGVTEGFAKKLILDGAGYRMQISGDTLSMSLGYSHPVELKIPKGLDVKVEKNELGVSGFDKELVGSFSALVRSKRKPEPYKGKGFHYEGEVIERKQGKRSVT